MFKHRLSTVLTPLCMGLVLVVLLAGLAACASKQDSVQGAPAPTQTPTPAQAKNCGVVQTGPGLHMVPTDENMAKQATDCFWQAYSQCQPATLVYRSSGVDTILARTFTIQNTNAHCTISDLAQHYIVPNKKPMATKTYTCTGVTQKTDGLQFTSCGEDGDIFVPNQ